MHLISYDIQNDSIRNKLAKTLIQFGLYRIQYSVFMGELKPTTLAKVEKNILTLSHANGWTSEDSIMILPLHQYTEDHLTFIGKEPHLWLEIKGDLHTLLL